MFECPHVSQSSLIFTSPLEPSSEDQAMLSPHDESQCYRTVSLIDSVPKSVPPGNQGAQTCPNDQLHQFASSPIGSLPPELLAEAFRLALPPLTEQTLRRQIAGREYMNCLYDLQIVSSSWNEVIDTTPGLWAVVSSGLSIEEATSNIRKSGNHPLTIHYHTGNLTNPDKHMFSRFLSLIESSRHRWQTMWFGQVYADSQVPHLLARPAPLVETIFLECYHLHPNDRETSAVFNHAFPRLYSLRLDRLLPHSDTTPFSNLRTLNLRNRRAYKIKMDWLMEVLHGSPLLESLSLAYLDFHMPDVPPAISTLELTHLKVFRSHNIQARAADYILRRLNAPCCVDFTLILNAGSAANYSPSDMLNSALTSFEPLLCRIGQRMTNRGNLYIDNYRLYWGWEVEEEPIELPSLYVAIELASFLSTIRWVERVVDLTGPEGWRAGSCQVTRVSPLGDEEIQSHFMRLKSIKTINVSHGGENTLRVLNMLRQTGPEPVLLGLRKLELQQEPGYWSESDLLAAIRARFLESGHSYPHLEVSVRNMAPFESYGYHTVNVVMDSRVLDQLRLVKEVTISFEFGLSITSEDM